MAKKLIGTEIGSYSFSAASRKVTISGLPMGYQVGIQQVLLITNAADQIILYNFADPALGGTMSNNVLTLVYNTTGMLDTDPLNIYIDLEILDESYAMLLRRMNKLLESGAVVDANGRQRMAVDAVGAGVTMPVSGTVAVTIAGGMGAASPVTIAAGQGPLGAANINFPNPSQPNLMASQNVQFVMEGPVDQRWRIMDQARASYATGIRANLLFS